MGNARAFTLDTPSSSKDETVRTGIIHLQQQGSAAEADRRQAVCQQLRGVIYSAAVIVGEAAEIACFRLTATLVDRNKREWECSIQGSGEETDYWMGVYFFQFYVDGGLRLRCDT